LHTKTDIIGDLIDNDVEYIPLWPYHSKLLATALYSEYMQSIVKRPALFLLTIGHLKHSLCPIWVPSSRPGCLDDTGWAPCSKYFAHAEFYIAAQYSLWYSIALWSPT